MLESRSGYVWKERETTSGKKNWTDANVYGVAKALRVDGCDGARGQRDVIGFYAGYET